ncbi:MAG: type II toxin-antitoxin system VapC family toxin [Bryobacterales bacterium]|nr:type II toxin-antitoxin system VapC family toxin [Bryobacterales bacterium]
MKVLLDTHIFLWAITDDPRLTNKQRAVFLDGGNDLYLSLASVWEMLIKVGIGKLPLPQPASPYIHKHAEKNRIVTLGIHAAHLAELEKLPPLHRDPFDRMLVAQARAEKMPILSSDPALKKYGVKLL